MRSVVAVVLVIAAFAVARADDVLWMRQYTRGQESGGYAAATSGTDIYAAGTFRLEQYPDLIVVKYDADGETTWVKTFDLDTIERMSDIAVGADAMPVFCSASEMMPPTSRVVKLTAAGDTAWTRSLAGIAATNLAVGGQNAVYVWGGTVDTLHFGYFALAQYSSGGAPGWTRYLRLGMMHQPGGCCVDRSGNVIAVGTALDSLGPQHYIVKFAADGDTIWAKSYPQIAAMQMLGVATDAGNNIIATAMEGENLKVIKCDSTGDVLWTVQSPEFPMQEHRNGVAIDAANNVLLPRFAPGGFVGLLVLGPDGSIRRTVQAQMQGNSYAVAVDAEDYPVTVGRSTMGVPALLTIKYAGASGVEGEGYLPNPERGGMCRTSLVGPQGLVRFSAPMSGNYRADLFGAAGNRVRSFSVAASAAGEQALSVAGAPSGAYVLRVSGPQGTEQSRVLVVR